MNVQCPVFWLRVSQFLVGLSCFGVYLSWFLGPNQCIVRLDFPHTIFDFPCKRVETSSCSFLRRVTPLGLILLPEWKEVPCFERMLLKNTPWPSLTCVVSYYDLVPRRLRPLGFWFTRVYFGQELRPEVLPPALTGKRVRKELLGH